MLPRQLGQARIEVAGETGLGQFRSGDDRLQPPPGRFVLLFGIEQNQRVLDLDFGLRQFNLRADFSLEPIDADLVGFAGDARQVTGELAPPLGDQDGINSLRTAFETRIACIASTCWLAAARGWRRRDSIRACCPE